MLTACLIAFAAQTALCDFPESDPVAPRLDAAHREKAKLVAAKAAEYLRSKQSQVSGGWGGQPDKPSPFPAFTGLAVTGLLLNGEAADSPAAAAAIKYMIERQKPDGGIYDGSVPTYNTAICLSALARFQTPQAKDAASKALRFLRAMQFGETVTPLPGTPDAPQEAVQPNHAFYGGWGYGRSGRPDLSNTHWVLDALHDSGVPTDDPAFKRAVVFLQRCQMSGTTNDQEFAKGSTQGGFIYSDSENRDKIGVGSSPAGTIEESLDDGTKVSRLRCYGSMTYAGFKSYLYAGLKHDDPRVLAASRWITTHYTIDENPGMGKDGFYYYLVTFSRALDAFGEPKVHTKDDKGQAAADRAWAEDIVDKLATLQQPDGSFETFKDRWLETDPVLVTAYSLIALGHAMQEPQAAAAAKPVEQ